MVAPAGPSLTQLQVWVFAGRENKQVPIKSSQALLIKNEWADCKKGIRPTYNNFKQYEHINDLIEQYNHFDCVFSLIRMIYFKMLFDPSKVTLNS